MTSLLGKISLETSFSSFVEKSVATTFAYFLKISALVSAV